MPKYWQHLESVDDVISVYAFLFKLDMNTVLTLPLNSVKRLARNRASIEAFIYQEE